MMYGNIFEQALGIEEPWYISDVKFMLKTKLVKGSWEGRLKGFTLLL